MRDYLAVAATRPVLLWGVPAKLLLCLFVGCFIPALEIYGVLYKASPYGFLILLGIWALSFTGLYKVALTLTRIDNNFVNIYAKFLSKTPQNPTARFWGGTNSYSAW